MQGGPPVLIERMVGDLDLFDNSLSRDNLRSMRSLAVLILAGLVGCSRPFPDGHPFVLLLPHSCSGYCFFMTVNKYTGDLKTAGGAATGVAGADAICAREKDANFAGFTGAGFTYVAMLTDGAARIACTSSNCGTSGASENVNWVFHANTEYYRSDGAYAFRTGPAGIPDLVAGLAAPFSASTADEWWTGFQAPPPYWVGAAPDAFTNCWGWTDSLASTGNYGVGNNTHGGAISPPSIFPDSCSVSRHLICVRR